MGILLASPDISDDDLAVMQIHNNKLKLNWPVYTSMSILGLSKQLNIQLDIRQFVDVVLLGLFVLFLHLHGEQLLSHSRREWVDELVVQSANHHLYINDEYPCRTSTMLFPLNCITSFQILL